MKLQPTAAISCKLVLYSCECAAVRARPTGHSDVTRRLEEAVSGAGAKYALNTFEHQAQQQHKDKYTEFIRAGRTAKKLQALQAPVDEGDVNLGLSTRRWVGGSGQGGRTKSGLVRCCAALLRWWQLWRGV
jgi:hypothetical protein